MVPATQELLLWHSRSFSSSCFTTREGCKESNLVANISLADGKAAPLPHNLSTYCARQGTLELRC